MNLLAAAAATPAQPAPAYNPAYQNQAYQNTTMQPDRPVQQSNWKAKVLGYGYLLFNMAVVIIIVVMVCKFVWAFEKIARTLDRGIVIRKDDTTT
jgi:hypothetical protein